jgi:hypothetical protein
MIISAKNGSPKFTLGQIVATPAALAALEASGQSPAEFLSRHVRLEQGDLCEEDHELNSEAVKDGSRILSSFKTAKGERIWVITEAADDYCQRVATTLLLPDEY